MDQYEFKKHIEEWGDCLHNCQIVVSYGTPKHARFDSCGTCGSMYIVSSRKESNDHRFPDCKREYYVCKKCYEDKCTQIGGPEDETAKIGEIKWV